jgi:hypothetical protein
MRILTHPLFNRFGITTLFLMGGMGALKAYGVHETEWSLLASGLLGLACGWFGGQTANTND